MDGSALSRICVTFALTTDYLKRGNDCRDSTQRPRLVFSLDMTQRIFSGRGTTVGRIPLLSLGSTLAR